MTDVLRWILAPLLLALLAGCSEVLYSRLSESQANEVLATLAQARIDARKTRVDESTWQVEVEASRVGAALVYLRGRGVPSQPAPNLGEVFKKDGLISSPMEERARYASALQDSIAATLRRIDGIADARVHVAIPQNDPLAQRVVPASAAVFVKHLPSLDIEMLTPSIKSMVMASVEGLDYRNVSLVAVRVDADVPPQTSPTRSASWIDAQAAGPGAAAFAAGAPSRDALAERVLAAMAGLGVVALAGWGATRRRRHAASAPRVAPGTGAATAATRGGAGACAAPASTPSARSSGGTATARAAAEPTVFLPAADRSPRP